MDSVLITQNPGHAIALLSGVRKKETNRSGIQTEVKLLDVVHDHIVTDFLKASLGPLAPALCKISGYVILADL
jgi:hypothetical protein